MMSFPELMSTSRRTSFNSRCSAKPKKSDGFGFALPTSPQTQFDLALTLLRHQLQQPMMTSSWSRGGCGGDVTRSATESLLLAALGLAVPVSPASPTGTADSEWVTSPPAVMGMTADSRRYKTELCRAYEERGLCRYGDRCQFAHGIDELRAMQRHPKYKTELCRTYHTSGFCPYGARCHFVHNPAASPPAAPPPTPRDDQEPGRHVSSMPCRPATDDLPLTLMSAALDKNNGVLPAHTTPCTQELVSSGNDGMTSILQRRRPKVTLTLDSAPPRASPPSAAAGAPSRRSSASMDSGYGSSLTASPTFPTGAFDAFSSPPPLMPVKAPPPAMLPTLPNGPMTAPLLTGTGRRLHSPADHGIYRPARHLDHGPRSGYSHRAPPPLMETPSTGAFKFDPYFVFDGLIARP